MKGFFLLAPVWALSLVSGCRTPGYEEREQEATRFRAALRDETRAYFATNSAPLTLADALALARTRTLKLTQQQLNRQLAEITRETAFAVFLPQVDATFSRQGTDKTIMRSLGSMSIQMSDQYVSASSVTLTQPVFTPATWLLFTEAKKALRSQDLIRARSEEMLDVQVAALFYQAAVVERMEQTYGRQLEATQALAAQIGALAKAGYALAAEQARVEARQASDRYQLRQARDALALTRARLFEILRFWPLEDVPLDGESMTAVLGREWVLTDEAGAAKRVPREQVQALTAEELLWQTLVNRKELWAGDQMIEIRKTEVLRALAGFLPDVYGSVSANHTTESLQTPTQYWAGGLGAVLSLFSGFKTVNEYRAAKALRKAEYQMQEDRALALLVSTCEAHQNWLRAFEQRDVAARALKAAGLDYEETQARYREAQETMSEVLDKLAALEAARVQAVAAEFACALAEIVLRDAAGVGLYASREMEKEAAEAFRKQGLLSGFRKERK